jgi:hypothetical protein
MTEREPRDASGSDAPDERDDEPQKGSPTPHPGEPDVRTSGVVTEDPDEEDVRRGNAAPGPPQY